MKRIALLLIFALVLGTSIVLVSCGDNSNHEEQSTTVCTHNWKDATTSEPKTCTLCGKTEGKPLSAYEALNDDEIEVFRALKNFASTLGAPSSLKLIDVKRGQTSANDSTEKVFVKVSANNAFGSPTSEVYVIKNGRLDIGGSAWYSAANPWYRYSVARINAALQEYFVSMGW